METYEILDLIEFTSDRKRMSIILKTPDEKIWVLCKGADSIINERSEESQLTESISQDILVYESKFSLFLFLKNENSF